MLIPLEMYSRNAATVRRFNALNRILEQSSRRPVFSKNFVRGLTNEGTLTIDNVSKELKLPRHPEYVPRNYGESIKSCGHG